MAVGVELVVLQEVDSVERQAAAEVVVRVPADEEADSVGTCQCHAQWRSGD